MLTKSQACSPQISSLLLFLSITFFHKNEKATPCLALEIEQGNSCSTDPIANSERQRDADQWHFFLRQHWLFVWWRMERL
jgi:hypothetical protein